MTTKSENGKLVPDGLFDDLTIHRQRQPLGGPGTWLSGSVAGYRYEALVFAEHAELESFELGDSRISKLWVRRRGERRPVYSFDRGLEVPAADAEVAAVVEFLAEGLADFAYGV